MPTRIIATTVLALMSAAITAAPASAQAGRTSAFLPLSNEPAPKLILDPPVPDRLAHGAAVIPYRTENFRILPVFGSAARDISPRAGHLHVSVDSLPWHWADVGDGGAVVVAGLPAGPHAVRIELATPEHKVILGQTVSFTVPAQR